MKKKVPEYLDFINSYADISKDSFRFKKNQIDRLHDCYFWFYIVEGNLPDLLVSRSGEIYEDFPHAESYSLVKNLVQIIVTDYNEIMLTLLTGAYGSTARTLRSTLETTLKIFAALVDKSILTGKISDKNKAMCGHEFRYRLDHYEFYNKMHGDEQKILDKWFEADTKFTLNQKAMSGISYILKRIDDGILGPIDFKEKNSTKKIIVYLYSQLSNYSHTGSWHFDYATDGSPNILKFKNDEFDEIFTQIMITTDIIASLVILSILFDLGFKEEYRKSFVNSLKNILNPIMNAHGGEGYFLTKRLINLPNTKLPFLELPSNMKKSDSHKL